MRNTKKVRTQWQFKMIGTMVLVMLLGMFSNFTMAVHAKATGRVKTNVNIRKEPGTTSDIIGTAFEGSEVTIEGQATDSQGMVWYQIPRDSETFGYVRSDYIDIKSGSVPSVDGPGEGSGSGPSEVTPIHVQYGKAMGAEIRVRAKADPLGDIVAVIEEGTEFQVDGYATASDGGIWYRVSVTGDNGTVNGFILENYVVLEEELQPAGEGGEGSPVGEGQPAPDYVDPYRPSDEYDLEYNIDEGVWYLIDYKAGDHGEQYPVTQLLEAAFGMEDAIEKNENSIKSQKVAIVLLVVLVAGLGFAVTMLFFKLKDIKDEEYYSTVEKETMQNRRDKRPQGTSNKTMYTMGESGVRPGNPVGQGGTGQRPPGSGQARPAGQGGPGQRSPGSGQARPAGQGGPGQRPQGSGQARTAGQGGQGNIEQGSQVRSSGQGNIEQGGQVRSSGPNNAGPRPGVNGQARPVGQGSNGQRPGGNGQPVQQQAGRADQSNPGWKSKNFMSEEDEFEFEFLNMDGNGEE
jgi:uncharacterized protein YgiM (DUF1202 family)